MTKTGTFSSRLWPFPKGHHGKNQRGIVFSFKELGGQQTTITELWKSYVPLLLQFKKKKEESAAMATSPKEDCKKRTLFPFSTFGDKSTLPGVRRPFWYRVKDFLEQCAESEDYKVHGMSIWRTLLVHEKSGVHIPLYTVEELLVNNSTSERYCDRCRITGNFSFIFSLLKSFSHSFLWFSIWVSLN